MTDRPAPRPSLARTVATITTAAMAGSAGIFTALYLSSAADGDGTATPRVVAPAAPSPAPGEVAPAQAPAPAPVVTRTS